MKDGNMVTPVYEDELPDYASDDTYEIVSHSSGHSDDEESSGEADHDDLTSSIHDEEDTTEEARVSESDNDTATAPDPTDAEQQLSTPTLTSSTLRVNTNIDPHNEGPDSTIILVEDLLVPGHLSQGCHILSYEPFLSAFGAGNVILKMTMSENKLHLERPYHVLYVGPIELKAQVTNKIGQALTAGQSTTSRYGGQAIECFDIYNVSSLATDTNNPEVELLPSSDLQLAVCHFNDFLHATLSNIDSQMLELHKLDTNDEQGLPQEPFRCEIPDLAIVVREQVGHTISLSQASQLSSVGIAVIELSIDPPTSPSGSAPSCPNTVRLQVGLDTSAATKWLALDTQTFDELDATQLNRHLAHLHEMELNSQARAASALSFQPAMLAQKVKMYWMFLTSQLPPRNIAARAHAAQKKMELVYEDLMQHIFTAWSHCLGYYANRQSVFVSMVWVLALLGAVVPMFDWAFSRTTLEDMQIANNSVSSLNTTSVSWNAVPIEPEKALWGWLDGAVSGWMTKSYAQAATTMLVEAEQADHVTGFFPCTCEDSHAKKQADSWSAQSKAGETSRVTSLAVKEDGALSRYLPPKLRLTLEPWTLQSCGDFFLVSTSQKLLWGWPSLEQFSVAIDFDLQPVNLRIKQVNISAYELEPLVDNRQSSVVLVMAKHLDHAYVLWDNLSTRFAVCSACRTMAKDNITELAVMLMNDLKHDTPTLYPTVHKLFVDMDQEHEDLAYRQFAAIDFSWYKTELNKLKVMFDHLIGSPSSEPSLIPSLPLPRQAFLAMRAMEGRASKQYEEYAREFSEVIGRTRDGVVKRFQPWDSASVEAFESDSQHVAEQKSILEERDWNAFAKAYFISDEIMSQDKEGRFKKMSRQISEAVNGKVKRASQQSKKLVTRAKAAVAAFRPAEVNA